MNLNSYYLHAFDCQNDEPFDGEHSLEVLKNILQSGGLKSRRLRGDTDTSRGGWNGLDYISLCDYSRKDDEPYNHDEYLRGYNAYGTYITQSLSFLIAKNSVKAIKPKLYAPIIFDWGSQYTMRRLGNCKGARFSDLVDEVHVKNMIPLDRVKGITIPVKYMISEHKPIFSTRKIKEIPPYTLKTLKEYIDELKELLSFHKQMYNIYDLETLTILENEDDVARTFEIAKNNIKR